MSKPRLIQHGSVMHEKDIFVTPEGYLALIIPGDTTLQEFVLDDMTKMILARDLMTDAAEKMAKKIESLEDVKFSLNNALADMERKYEGRED